MADPFQRADAADPAAGATGVKAAEFDGGGMGQLLAMTDPKDQDAVAKGGGEKGEKPAQEIIKDKPTPSRAKWAPLGQAYGRDYSTSDVTKVVAIGSGTPAADTRHGGVSVAVVVNGQP